MAANAAEQSEPRVWYVVKCKPYGDSVPVVEMIQLPLRLAREKQRLAREMARLPDGSDAQARLRRDCDAIRDKEIYPLPGWIGPAPSEDYRKDQIRDLETKMVLDLPAP